MKKFAEKYSVVIMIAFCLSFTVNQHFTTFIFGALVFSLGFFAIFTFIKLKKIGIERVGKYLSFEKGSEGNYNPNIKFTTTEGERIIGKPILYGSTDLSEILTYNNLIGTEILILYDPEKPAHFIVVEEMGFTLFVCTAVALAGLFFILKSISVI